MSRYTEVRKDSRRGGDRDTQSSLIKSFLEFGKGKPLTQPFLFQESVILRDPPEVAFQSESPNGRGTES